MSQHVVGSGRTRTLWRSSLLFWGVSIPVLGFLAWEITRGPTEVLDHYWVKLAWVAALAIVSFFPLRGWQSAPMIADSPILLAAAILFRPLDAALICLVGEMDPRELRGQMTLEKALYNRSQAALLVYVDSLVAHQFGVSASNFLGLALLCALLQTIHTGGNYLFVGTGIAVDFGYPFRQVVRRMKLGTWTDYALAQTLWTTFGAVTVVLYSAVGVWALASFVAPILIGRLALRKSQLLVEAQKAYRLRESALAQLSRQIQIERIDERKLVAADLHDEVLQPLFKVTLMANVLRADLVSGRLLDMDKDLPELVEAAEVAAGTLRSVISDLRRSPLGRLGLTVSLQHLVREIRDRNALEVQAELAEVELGPLEQLAFYQISKEAIGNAVTHARAQRLAINLRTSKHAVVLEVRDDGIGFDPYLEKAGHFGLTVMKERADAIGAYISIDSSPGGGCRITLALHQQKAERQTDSAHVTSRTERRRTNER